MAENGDKPQKVDDLASKLGVDPVLLGKTKATCEHVSLLTFL